MVERKTNINLIAACHVASKMFAGSKSALWSMVHTETTEVPTMAVDKWWRLYYNPEFLKSFEDEGVRAEWFEKAPDSGYKFSHLPDVPSEQYALALIILHEFFHLMFRHAARCQSMDVVADTAKAANYSQDMCINHQLELSYGYRFKGGVTFDKYDYTPGQPWEWYFYEMLNQPSDEPDGDQPSPSSSGEGESDSEDGGDQGSEEPESGSSGSDGIDREWELGEPTEETGGLQPHQQEEIIKKVAEDIQKESSGGSGNAWIEWSRQNVKVKRGLINQMLKFFQEGVDLVCGTGSRSYTRERHSLDPDFIMPVDRMMVPKITVIVDTSGSMSDSDFNKAAGVVDLVLREFPTRSGLRICAGDTEIANDKEVTSVKQLDLKGGGGTNMGQLIEDAAQHDPKPQLIMVITDGFTPWCSDVGIPTFACTTSTTENIPSWINTFDMTK